VWVTITRIFKSKFSKANRNNGDFIKKYIILCAYGLSLALFGLLFGPLSKIPGGLYKIIVDPDYLITDYIGVGGLGPAFINSGLLTLVSIYILYRLKINVTGATISTVWLMSGFALFGKNIFNIWFIIGGVFLYAKYQKEKFNKYVYIAFLGTSLAPLVTQVMMGVGLPGVFSIPLGALTGLFIGFILPPLSSSLMRVHHGFSLYNIGFTSGVIGTIFVSVLRLYGITTESRLIWTSGNNISIGIFLSFMFTSMVLMGFLMSDKSFDPWKNMLHYPGKLITDFVILEGFGPSLLNMGINGLFATLFVLLTGGDLNGPTVGGIFTIVGFSSFGKHIKNMVPIFLGVLFGALTSLRDIGDPLMSLTALFATTLCPISGEFGWKWGVAAGFIQCSVSLNIGYLHGGFNLYNSGFAGGLVAAAVVPIIEAFREDEL